MLLSTSTLNNPRIKELYRYLGLANQWVTLYKLDGEFIEHGSGGIVSKISREKAFNGIWFQMNRTHPSSPSEILINNILGD